MTGSDEEGGAAGAGASMPTTLQAADIHAILKAVPHRYPFLMIDRIVDIDGDRSAVGIKNVTINEPHFTGHFPAFPIMPGVLLIEGMAQTAAAICILATGGRGDGRVVFFMTIDEAKFRKPVIPGDRVEFHVSKIKQRRNIWRFACEAQVDGAKVCEAIIGAMLGDE